ncbi:hypothetical protein FHS43_001625 [Streptosporangium becharense]|uniref:Uncharacterized protein n=1 Tax=Streptosporangium becharense TaxID=1816182 RepID=A0A7W9MJI8_9ACTN|nr:hypothetical protein [Streptosporangium becharense]MBB2910362.1 hypothetical protein [Streptosporangium becharense]MBB5823105.1 hypothetical protein [Streptosporangium becharense]
MNRWVRLALMVLLLVIFAAVVGVSLRGVRFSSSSSGEERARCVDTSSQQSDGTHLVVDDRNCESGGDEAGRRYRWEGTGSSDGLGRSVLELIRELLDGRR